MRVESYQEDDMRKAMAKVRAEMGQDAVIISSRRVAGRTEIMAASDYDPNLLETEIKKLSARQTADSGSMVFNSARLSDETEQKDQTESESETETVSADKPRPQSRNENVWNMITEEQESEAEKVPSLFDMQEELGRLRKLFEGELAQLAWRDVGKGQPNRLALLSRLETTGISKDIASKIIEKVLPCSDLELAWSRVIKLLGRVTRISQDDVLNEGGVIALIGPTGVGKTTTAAKIAAQFALRHGRKQVAFITTDSYRVGGQEQLISLGSILGVPVQVVNNSQEMHKTLESFSQRKLVIIDTAGISQRDTHLAEQFDTLDAANTKIHPYLVMPATAQESVINETIKAFSKVNISAGIITKTDESGSVGAALSGLIRNKLPAAFIGTGQGVPEDLIPAQTDFFLKSILETYAESQKQTHLQKTKSKRKKTINV